MNQYLMKAYKYNGKEHYEQPLELFEIGSDFISLKGAIGRQLTHHTRNRIFTFDKKTIEYFFFERWYTAAFVFNDEGICDYVYCNVCLPSELKGNTVSFIDLDVDVIYEKGEIKVVDLDEFEENSKIYQYPEALIQQVKKTTEQLKTDIACKKHPFDLYII
ncbi:MAG: DUF402 domain-containing protein [Clostridia bacterium]|nr:DUF402 domain-containing protein [Clostridia bacterium]